MLARRTLIQLATRALIGLGALFLVGVLLAAIPAHRPPAIDKTPSKSDAAPRAAAPAHRTPATPAQPSSVPQHEK